ncbi:MAG: AAA family ATPase [Patescibacteria group bacterium]
MSQEIEINAEFKNALDLMENTRSHFFITGRAGTGKSTLLQYFREHTAKKIAVLAPTGVAALNVNGETVHSFFGFMPETTLDSVKKLKDGDGRGRLYKELDAIIIDEVSMVRADLLDCADKFLRLNGKKTGEPFGGIQMIFIGDLYQLPPVVTNDQRAMFKDYYESPYFFSANVFKNQQTNLLNDDKFSFQILELEKIYRQKDEKFINILNCVRNNRADNGHLKELNKRVDKLFKPKLDDFWICLTSTNDQASKINKDRLKLVKGKSRTYQANLSGETRDQTFPTDRELTIKKGAQIMMVNNSSGGLWVNGSIGQIEGIEPDPDSGIDLVMVRLLDGTVVPVSPYRWDVLRWTYDFNRKNIQSESVGSFIQYPFRLAWAITIHKSQGKTFDQVVIDVGPRTFASGQMYVALSRCRSLEGLVLKQEIGQSHILTDWRVSKFLTGFRYAQSESQMPIAEKIKIIESAIDCCQKLEITYLKADDTKSKRVIIPNQVGEMEYMGKNYIGVEAMCLERNQTRVFRVDRILAMRETN